MKIPAVPTAALLALALALTTQPARGATCSDAETTEIAELYANVTASDACADLASNAAATSLDYCQDAACLSLLQDVVGDVPDCEDADGVNKQQGLAAILSYCDNVTATMDASASGSDSAAGSVGGSGDSSAADSPASGSNGAARRVLSALALAAPVVAAALLG